MTAKKKILPVKIIAICGSLRQNSYTRMALEIALEGARISGAATELLDLRDYELVFYQDDLKEYPADVQRLRRQVREAQGIILGTPEYHGSLSGVLKNALDLMGFSEFEGKMLGLIGVSGGKLGAINALNSLRNIGRNLHAWVLPQQVSVPEAWRYFSDDGTLNDPETAQRLQNIGTLIARFASLHELKNHQQFVEMWQELPSNPGGKKE